MVVVCILVAAVMLLLLLLLLLPVLEGVSAPSMLSPAIVVGFSATRAIKILQRDHNHAPTRYFSRSP